MRGWALPYKTVDKDGLETDKDRPEDETEREASWSSQYSVSANVGELSAKKSRDNAPEATQKSGSPAHQTRQN